MSTEEARVAYAFIGHTNPGVRKKILNQMAGLRQKGVSVEGFSLSNEYREPSYDAVTRVHSLPVGHGLSSRVSRRRILWRLESFLFRREAFRALERALALHGPFDLLYLRYPIADFNMVRFLDRSRPAVVFEHNSKELEELRLLRRRSFWDSYNYQAERAFGAAALRRARGLVCVSDDIRSYELSRLKGAAVPAVTVSNGIRVNDIPLSSPRPAYDGQRLTLIFLAGSASEWHGVDLLLKGLQSYRGPVEVSCLLVGRLSEQNQALARSEELRRKVTVIDTTEGRALDELIARSHLAVGSLALHRVGIRQGSSLKIREYLARGLPFILGGEDVDLAGSPEIRAFYHCTRGETEQPVDIAAVVAFADKVLRIPQHAERIRAFAEQQVDFDVKMGQLGKFLRARLEPVASR